ncbi:hypothetical protein J6590_096629 [Homalodisca vitripennis]|nr:hypothetical protein J6590_096629 [Homalodisca vitripennis]
MGLDLLREDVRVYIDKTRLKNLKLKNFGKVEAVGHNNTNPLSPCRVHKLADSQLCTVTKTYGTGKHRLNFILIGSTFPTPVRNPLPDKSVAPSHNSAPSQMTMGFGRRVHFLDRMLASVP